MNNSAVIGYHAITEYLQAPPQGACLFLNRRQSDSSRKIRELTALAEKKHVPVRKVSPQKLDSLSGGLEHRGIVLSLPGSADIPATAHSAHAYAAARNTASESSGKTIRTIDDCIEAAALKKEGECSTVLILDGVTDPHNLGAVLRSADLFGVLAVVVPGRRSVHVNETVRKVSSGASRYVPVVVVTNLVKAMQKLQKAGDFWIYAADMDGEQVCSVDFPPRRAVVMGSEGKGVSRLVRESSDGIVSIPTGGHIDSLNVSVAAGILLYEMYRRQFVRS